MKTASDKRNAGTLAAVHLQLTDGHQSIEWLAEVVFVSGLIQPLLGLTGSLDYFDVTFYGDERRVTLSPNELISSVQRPVTRLV